MHSLFLAFTAAKRYNLKTMKAEIIATGSELLLGNVADTNTCYLAEQLALLGIDLFYTSSVGDNHERLLAALKLAWQRSDLILTTGGLGPTQGDITRETIADLFGEKIEIDPGMKATLEKFFHDNARTGPAGESPATGFLTRATPLSKSSAQTNAGRIAHRPRLHCQGERNDCARALMRFASSPPR